MHAADPAATTVPPATDATADVPPAAAGEAAASGVDDATRERILGPLDPGQRAAAEQVRGPVAILAGAGTGKTTTVTHRIAWQVATGAADPREILAVTFTRKAAGELRERLAALGVRGVEARTFHAAATWMHGVLYERYAGRPMPRLLQAKARLLRPLIDRLPMPLKFQPTADVASDIEWAKVNMIEPARFEAEAEAQGRETSLPLDLAARVYEQYERRRRDAGAWDFEDLLRALVELFDEHPEAIERIRSRFTTFTVDEYQDVSPLQQALLDRWLGDRDDLCVVGDDQQTIYTFAGASASHLLRFEQRFPQAHVVALETSYRSTPAILEPANRIASVLQREAGSRARTLGAAGGEAAEAGPAPELQVLADEEAEARRVVAWLRERHEDGVALEELAVLVRANQHTEPFEEELARAGVPYTVVGGSFMQRPAARQVLPALRSRARQGESFGPGQLAQVVAEAAQHVGWDPDAASDDDAGGGGRGGKRAAREEATRQGDLKRFVALAQGAEAEAAASVAGFLADLERRFASAESSRGVQLMTLHKAKGLEFDGVALPRLAERTLPWHRSGSQPADVLEERRLFYVGITRARRHLLLTCAPTSSRGPSRFLAEAGFEVPAARGSGSSAGAGGASASASPVREQLEEGARERFDALREWRIATAREAGKPAYTVFNDRTLAGIAATVPGSLDELAGVPGVGPAKLERHGDDVLRVLAEHAAAG